MRRVLSATITTAVLVLAGLPATHAATGPELRVSQGTVKVSHGRLQGFLVVRNAGGSASRRTTAQLIVRNAGTERIIERYLVLRLKPGRAAQSDIDLPLPTGLQGRATVLACAPRPSDRHAVPHRCRTLGTIGSSGGSHGAVPTDPIPYTADRIFSVDDTVAGSPSNYWAVVPSSYRRTRPSRLLIWLHGCGGQSEYEIAIGSPAVRGGKQDWITVSPGGREYVEGQDSGCWSGNTDQPKVYAAIHDAETHFNIDRKQIVIGGYSAGGDLAYRTIFDHSLRFAGVLAENTSPFRDTGSTRSHSLGEAGWRFNVVHLAHRQDEVYPLDGVKREVGALIHADFPVTFLTRTGAHYDAHTESDAETYLIPHMDDGWTAP